MESYINARIEYYNEIPIFVVVECYASLAWAHFALAFGDVLDVRGDEVLSAFL